MYAQICAFCIAVTLRAVDAHQDTQSRPTPLVFILPLRSPQHPWLWRFLFAEVGIVLHWLSADKRQKAVVQVHGDVFLVDTRQRDTASKQRTNNERAESMAKTNKLRALPLAKEELDSKARSHCQSADARSRKIEVHRSDRSAGIPL